MVINDLIIRCLRCGQKNRIRRDRMNDEPMCGRCGAHLDKLILRCLACGTKNIVKEERLHHRPICGKCGVPLYQGYADDISDNNFDNEILAFPGPVIMCCWAPWCSSTRTMIPILNELGRKYAGGVKVAKLNTYDNQRIVTEYEIKKTPTLLFFKNGKLVHRMEGETTKENLEKSIHAIIREIVDEPT